MIDHLRRYTDEEEAKADPLVSVFIFEEEWDASRVIPGCRVYTVTGTHEDDEGNIVEDREYLPYWYLWIATPTVLEQLVGVSIIIADREKALAGEPFIIDTLISAEDLPRYNIEPVIAGSNYPFGRP